MSRSSLVTVASSALHYNGGERDTTKMEVISREHIKPSSPTPLNLRYFKQSLTDQAQIPEHIRFMFFYQNHSENDNVEDVIRGRSKHLKQSLSETLTRFYPFAGRIAGEFLIDCNDEGVYFVETRVDDHLKNVLKKPDNKFLRRLIPTLPNQQLLGSYVSMVQVNFFKCGGVAITVQHNHKVADGSSNITFLKAWAAVARQDPNNQIYPKFVLSSMFPQIPNLSYSPYFPLWYMAITPAILKHGKCAISRFVFDAVALKELKAKASKHKPVSRILAVLALLWKCISTETGSNQQSVMNIPVNARPRCSPPLPETIIGNISFCVCPRFDPASSDLEVASMAGQMKNAIEGVTADLFEEIKGESGQVKVVELFRSYMENFSDYKTECYWTSSFCNFGTNEADFGWGKPIWSCSGDVNEDTPIFKNMMWLMDSCSGDGIEVWVTLEQKVMEALKCNKELLSFASVDPSPLN